MKEIYNKLWELAKPYYQKGRPMDVDHVQWMIGDALMVCEKEGLDSEILLPLAILHDVGYAETGPAYFNKNLKKAHMEAGKRIAKELLKKVNYPKDKTEKIAYYISVHDNWIFGESELFNNDIILGTFNDLDFTWMATEKGFKAVMEVLKKTPEEMYEFIDKDEKITKRPFSTKTTKELYNKYMQERKREIK